LWNAYFQGRISRGQLLKAAALAAGAAAVPGTVGAQGAAGGVSFPFFPQVPSGSYTPEAVADIVGNMLTQLYLHVNAGVTVLRTPALAARLGVTSGVALSYFQSFVAANQYQIDFWSGLVPGAAPVTTTFTIDPKIVSDAPTFLMAGEAVDDLRVATDIAATRQFAEIGQPTLAKYATQLAAVDAEMRVSVRYLGALAGLPAFSPPTNKAFETDLILYTRDAIAILKGLGLIGGSGVSLPYPGRDAVLAAAGSTASAVTQKQPNNATTTVTVTGLGSLTGERA
jgi:hypothetical protein